MYNICVCYIADVANNVYETLFLDFSRLVQNKKRLDFYGGNQNLTTFKQYQPLTFSKTIVSHLQNCKLLCFGLLLT